EIQPVVECMAGLRAEERIRAQLLGDDILDLRHLCFEACACLPDNVLGGIMRSNEFQAPKWMWLIVNHLNQGDVLENHIGFGFCDAVDETDQLTQFDPNLAPKETDDDYELDEP